MKMFSNSDVIFSGKYPSIYVEVEDLIHDPLPWQVRGLQQTASGYGAKLTTPHKINFCGKFYRLYCTIYSNIGLIWFTSKGQKFIVS